MRRAILTSVMCVMVLANRADGQSVLAAQVAPAFPVPMAEGLFRIASAEPLGKGGYSLRYLNEAYKITVGKVGEGTSYTGHLGLGYGLTNSVDFVLSVPILLDVAGGLTKYGTGDIVTSLKLGFPGRFPSSFYFGFDLSAVHPYGYKGREALNVRPFHREARELSLRALMDLNRETVGFHLNLGYLLSSGSKTPGLMYGAGVEVGKNQIFTMTAEYWNEPGAGVLRSKRAVIGAHMNLWWLRLEAGIEKGMTDDLPNVAGILGLRIHKSLGVKARGPLGGRTRVAAPRGSGKPVRVAVVNFSGFEQDGAGEMVAEKIKTALTRFGNIRVVDVGTGAEFLDPDAALRLAQVSDADVVITGRILRREMTRESQPNVPLVVGFPQTLAQVEADIRVIERDEKGELLSTQIMGKSRQNRGVRLFPMPGDDRSSYLNVVEKERIWSEAVQQMVDGLFQQMAQTFKWLPG